MTAEAAGKSLGRSIWGWVWPIVIGWLVAAGIMKWLFSFAIVPTSSMWPDIPNPCYILVDHVVTELHSPYRGEVVLFHFPDDPRETYVKRIIGMPGDTVSIHNGHVYINSQVLAEPYLHGLVTENNYGPYLVPAGHYFMLGDNRNVSKDSRFWVHKYVAESAITGRADRVVWPLSKWKSIQ